MRTVNMYFMIIFSIELVVFSGLCLWIYAVSSSNQMKLVEILAKAFAAFGSLFLTTGLLYHNLLQRAELRIMDIVINPINVNGQTVAKRKYKGQGFYLNPGTGQYESIDRILPTKEGKFLKVECTSKPSKIRISIDITNVGTSETTIHELKVDQLKPTKKVLGIYSRTEVLPHQRKVTWPFDYPEGTTTLSGRKLVLNIAVHTSTEQKSRMLEVVPSRKWKSIKWRQFDC